MGDFGHIALTGDMGNKTRFHLDAWGAGPFWIIVDRKRYVFEDSDMFGPLLLRKTDFMPAERQPGERHRFWVAYTMWRKAGRPLKTLRRAKVAVWKEPQPGLYWKDERGISHFVRDPDLWNGPYKQIEKPND